MTEKRMVFFHTQKLAKEFGMRANMVGVLLKQLGCQLWSTCTSSRGSIWYWEE